MNPP